MASNLVLAVDPGKATGLAYYTPIQAVHYSNELPYDRVGEEVDNMIRIYQGDVTVVCENFFITARTSRTTGSAETAWSLKLIGVLDYLCRIHHLEPPVLQAPADAKRLATDARLKSLGWWQGGAGHADDASRHLLVYLAKHRIIDPRRLVE